MCAATQAAGGGAPPEEERDYVVVWRAWLQEECRARPEPAYRWMKQEGFSQPVPFPARPDGSPTANVRLMDGHLREAWGPSTASIREAP